MYNAVHNPRSKVVIKRDAITRVQFSDCSLETGDCLVLEHVHILPQALLYINELIAMCKPQSAMGALSIAMNNLRPDPKAARVVTDVVCH